MSAPYKFVFLRGEPGVGKITVARLLEAELGMRVFWFHDIKNAVVRIVADHRIPRLMDAVTAPILEHVLAQGGDLMYVRPSRDSKTVEQVRAIVEASGNYLFMPVRLTASRETLVRRVSGRDDPFRISNAADLHAYLDGRPDSPLEGEHVIVTDELDPRGVAEAVKRALHNLPQA